MKPLSIYIHWPFCASKCPYCDFNSRPLTGDLDEARWLHAYLAELDHYARQLPDREIATIYFGGGTPSLMQQNTIAAILNKIAARWKVQQNCEITIEANPSSSEMNKFLDFKRAGINRLSLGVQSLRDDALTFLGRAHDSYAAQKAIEMASKVFDRFSFDLIYARAGQTPEAWQQELQHAVSFAPSHLSLYQLTIEPGTVFAKRSANETLTVDEAVAIDLYRATQTTMREAGLPAYEVSNFAAPGQESRHNLVYWRYGDYLGIGPGAHGRFVAAEGKRCATENHRLPAQWLQQVEAECHGQSCCDRLTITMAQQEALLMGLRLVEGIEESAWSGLFGQSLDLFLNVGSVSALAEAGLLVRGGGRLATTQEGLLRLNAIIERLVP